MPSQKETSIPSIIFQGRAVKLRGWKHIWGMYHLQGLQNDGFMAPFLLGSHILGHGHGFFYVFLDSLCFNLKLPVFFQILIIQPSFDDVYSK